MSTKTHELMGNIVSVFLAAIFILFLILGTILIFNLVLNCISGVNILSEIVHPFFRGLL